MKGVNGKGVDIPQQALSTGRLTLKILGLLLQMLPFEWKRRLGAHLGSPDVRWSLMQLRRFGFVPQHVCDVGAFKGDWTRICLDIFPEAVITCIEPQHEPIRELEKLASEHSNVKVF